MAVTEWCFIAVIQILLDNITNPTFDDIKLSNESINRDIVLSPDKTHLYAMTNSTVWSSLAFCNGCKVLYIRYLICSTNKHFVVEQCQSISEFVISQCSVTTCLRWDGYCLISFGANVLRFPAVQKFWRSVEIWQSYRDFVDVAQWRKVAQWTCDQQVVGSNFTRCKTA